MKSRAGAGGSLRPAVADGTGRPGWRLALPGPFPIKGGTTGHVGTSRPDHHTTAAAASPARRRFHDPGPKRTNMTRFGPGSWETSAVGTPATPGRVAGPPRSLLPVAPAGSAGSAGPGLGSGADAGVFAYYAVAQVVQGGREQAGYVHLGDAQAFADLGLAHVPVEAHHQQPLLADGQVTPVRPDRLDVECVLKLRILGPHDLGQAAGLVAAGQRRIEGRGLEHQVGSLGVAQVFVADPEVRREFVRARRPGQALGQVDPGPPQFLAQFLRGPLDVNLPAFVAEVALDLATHARLGVGGQVAAQRGV